MTQRVSIRSRWIAAALCAGFGSASAQGAQQVLSRDAVGCRDEATYQRLTQISLDGDAQAFQRFVVAQTLARQCTLWRSGERAFLNGARWYGLGCLRRPSEVDCYWTAVEAFAPDRR